MHRRSHSIFAGARRSTPATWRMVGPALALASTLAGTACDPYEDLRDEDYGLGPVDPVSFPPGNLGTRGDRKRPGIGTFAEVTAYVGGDAVGYVAFPLPPAPSSTFDPLRLRQGDAAYINTPTAYVFDVKDDNPFPEDYDCQSPPNYSYDRQRDEVRYDEQGHVFSALPTASYTEGTAVTSTYRPIVREARTSSSGQPCQRIKSLKLLETVRGGRPDPGDRYLAWLIIDPGAAVYPREDPTGMEHWGVGLQRWGWYGRYLVAYLDGGYIPTVDTEENVGTMAMPQMATVKRMRPQRLYIPRTIPGAAGAMPAPGVRGAGYDVLEARRGEEAYSPLCQVYVYGDAMNPVAVADLPRNAADIAMLNPAPAAPATYVFCLQVR